MVDFSQYCTVLAKPAARSQIALIDTRGAYPTLALGNSVHLDTPFTQVHVQECTKSHLQM